MKLLSFKLPTLFLLAFLPLQGFGADALKTVPLWPSKVPGESSGIGEEKDITKESDNNISGKRVIRLGNVSNPTLTLYPAPAAKSKGVTVLVCPGGAYHILAMDLEGTEICEWFNSIGVDAALLKYRVPRRANLEKHHAPLQDAQRAIALIRSKGAEWGIATAKVGVLGFSAGGHLATVLSTSGNEQTYPKQDEADQNYQGPDFSMLIYPGYLSVKEKNDEISPELKITSKTPQSFIVMTQDDPVRVEGALAYAAALQKEKVPFELHVYPTGGHGYGLRKSTESVSSWPARAEDWLKATVLK